MVILKSAPFCGPSAFKEVVPPHLGLLVDQVFVVLWDTFKVGGVDFQVGSATFSHNLNQGAMCVEC